MGVARFHEFQLVRGIVDRLRRGAAGGQGAEFRMDAEQYEFILAGQIGQLAAQQFGPR